MTLPSGAAARVWLAVLIAVTLSGAACSTAPDEARDSDEVLAALEGFSAGMSVPTEFGDLEVVALGSEAAHASASFETTMGEGSDGFTFGGLMSFVLMRSDGRWQIAGGHVSSPRQEWGG